MLPEHIKTAIQKYIPLLGQWLEVDRACEMAELIIDTKPDVVVEIGTFRGQSLISQAFALRENNKGVIYGIDPWQVSYAVEGNNDPENDDWWRNKIDLELIHRECMQAIWDHHLEPWTVIIRAASHFAYRLFEYNIDILYIDGNHSEQASSRDVELYVPRVNQGGYVWLDDCQWQTLQKALGMVATMCDLVKDGGQYRLYKKR